MKLEGLRGSGQLYNAIPIEVDANAALRFRPLRRRDGPRDGRSRERGRLKDGVLFRSLTPPASIETLPRRVLAFLVQFADLCELYAARRERPITEFLDEAWPGMARAWEVINAIDVNAARPQAGQMASPQDS